GRYNVLILYGVFIIQFHIVHEHGSTRRGFSRWRGIDRWRYFLAVIGYQGRCFRLGRHIGVRRVVRRYLVVLFAVIGMYIKLLLNIVERKSLSFFHQQETPVAVLRHTYGKLLCRVYILLKQYLYMYRAWRQLADDGIILSIAWHHFTFHFYIKGCLLIALYIDIREILRLRHSSEETAKYEEKGWELLQLHFIQVL